jgi:hypothetical protein
VHYWLLMGFREWVLSLQPQNLVDG